MMIREAYSEDNRELVDRTVRVRLCFLSPRQCGVCYSKRLPCVGAIVQRQPPPQTRANLHHVAVQLPVSGA
jgi:hypothetical protein